MSLQTDLPTSVLAFRSLLQHSSKCDPFKTNSDLVTPQFQMASHFTETKSQNPYSVLKLIPIFKLPLLPPCFVIP